MLSSLAALNSAVYFEGKSACGPYCIFTLYFAFIIVFPYLTVMGALFSLLAGFLPGSALADLSEFTPRKVAPERTSDDINGTAILLPAGNTYASIIFLIGISIYLLLQSISLVGTLFQQPLGVTVIVLTLVSILLNGTAGLTGILAAYARSRVLIVVLIVQLIVISVLIVLIAALSLTVVKDNIVSLIFLAIFRVALLVTGIAAGYMVYRLRGSTWGFEGFRLPNPSASSGSLGSQSQYSEVGGLYESDDNSRVIVDEHEDEYKFVD